VSAGAIWVWAGLAAPLIKVAWDVCGFHARTKASIGAEEDRLLAKYDRARETDLKNFYALEDSYTKLCVDAHKASNRAQEAQAKFAEISSKKGAKPSEVIRAGNLATETMVTAAQLCNKVLQLEHEVEWGRSLHDLNPH